MVRTTEWPDFEGGFVAVEQRLSVNEDGDPTYQYSRQSKATQLYHEAFCLEKHARPAGGEAVLNGSIAAWICEVGDEDTPLDLESAPPQYPGAFMNGSTDHVAAHPSRSAPPLPPPAQRGRARPHYCRLPAGSSECVRWSPRAVSTHLKTRAATPTP